MMVKFKSKFIGQKNQVAGLNEKYVHCWCSLALLDQSIGNRVGSLCLESLLSYRCSFWVSIKAIDEGSTSVNIFTAFCLSDHSR